MSIYGRSAAPSGDDGSRRSPRGMRCRIQWTRSDAATARARGRQPARGRVRGQRRAGLQRLPDPGRRGRAQRRPRGADLRRRRAAGRRAVDGRGRVHLGPLATRDVRAPDRRRARRAGDLSGRGGGRAVAHLSGARAWARTTPIGCRGASWPIPATPSTRWRARSWGSIRGRSARRSARRRSRSERSRSAPRCRWLPFVVSSGGRALGASLALTAGALFAVGCAISLFTGRGALRGGAAHAGHRRRGRRGHVRHRPAGRRGGLTIRIAACLSPRRVRARLVV